MNSQLIYPVLGMMSLTLVVFFKVLFDRVSELKTRKINPQKVATREESGKLLLNINSSDHLKNLFEVPVLFYVLSLLFLYTNKSNTMVSIIAWLYVFSRFIHAVIHCTYNKVIHRFYAFLGSTFFLLLYFVYFIYELLV